MEQMSIMEILKRIQKIENLADQSMIFSMLDIARDDETITYDEYQILWDIADWYDYGKYIHNLNMWHEGQED